MRLGSLRVGVNISELRRGKGESVRNLLEFF